MEMQEKLAIYTMAKIQGMTPIKFKERLEYYKTAQEYCEKNNVKIINTVKLEDFWVQGEDAYPGELNKHVSDAPIVLFKKGSLQTMPAKLVAIVGTRNVTDYGVRAAKNIAEYFIDRGYVIISGMAAGIDSIVHQIAIDRGVPTIAVLGTDVNTPYPRENLQLYRQILQLGLVISENETKEDYNKWVFPRRNRIIAGMAEIVVVVEAPLKSGAIITANFAFDYGKKLYAVPGNMFQENSWGCNMLINQNKAEIFIKTVFDSEQLTGNDSLEAKILKLINSGCDTLDDLQIKLYTSKSEVKSKLLELEVANLIAKDLFGRYTLVKM